ncbi:hypothetical protein D3C81_1647900 [compost metagenome]
MCPVVTGSRDDSVSHRHQHANQPYNARSGKGMPDQRLDRADRAKLLLIRKFAESARQRLNLQGVPELRPCAM